MLGSVPKTMLAWQKSFPSKKPILNSVPVPTPAEDAVLIKILAAGVCHSDFAIIGTEDKPPSWPSDTFTLGHEGCGEVVAIGSSVSHLQLGDIVSINPVMGCGLPSCGECSRGLPQICHAVEGERYGLGHDGSYAPYIAVKARACAKVPAGVTPEQAAVATDACMTAYHALVRTANVQKEQTIVIYGIGGLGLNALQIAQSIGAKIIVVDNRLAPLDEAVKLGLPKDRAVHTDEGLVAYAKRTGAVIDTIVDFVGIPESFEASQNAVRHGGKLVQVGLLSPELPLRNFLSVGKHLSILCSYGGTMSDLKECLQLIADGKLQPQVGKSDLNDFPSVLEDLHAGKIKSRMVLVPSQER